jgi:hypothetical protein
MGSTLEKRRLEDDEAGFITETRSGGPTMADSTLKRCSASLTKWPRCISGSKSVKSRNAWSSSAAKRGSRRSRDKHGAKLFV